MTWVATAAALIAAGASVYNSRQTIKKQDQAVAEGIRQKSRVQQRADKRIGEELNQLQRSTPEAERVGAVTQYRDALRGTEQQAQAGQALAGLSREYDAATTAGQQRTGGYLSDVINSLSRIDAAGLQRQREGISAGNLSTDLRMLGREAEGIDFLANMRARGVRRNPYLDALSAGLSAYSAGAGGSATGAIDSPDAYGGIYRTTGTGAGWRNGYGG